MDATIDVARSGGESPVRKNPQKFSATMASGIAVALELYLKERRQDGTSVLQAAGLKHEALGDRYSRFPVEQFAVALELFSRRENDPFFGLHFGEWYRPIVMLACNYAISSASDLRGALHCLQDHRNMVAKIPTQFCDQGVSAEFSWTIEVASEHPRHVIDFKAMRTLKNIQQATGPDWRPLRVNLAYEKPENISEYSRLLGPNVHFDQPQNSFWIDLGVLAMPMPDADPDIHHMARNSLLNPIRFRQNDGDPIDRLRRFIVEQLGKNDITLETASTHMGVTPQQLHRLMKKHGTCFQCVLDETRKAHAAHYLRETKTRFSEITYLLGFSDQSTFSRAVKRWFGATPKEVRRNSR